MVYLLNRALNTLKQDGPKELANETIGFFQRVSPLGASTSSQNRRIDNEARWEFIQSHIGEHDDTLLDIGSAEGFFTANASKYGLASLGIEISPERIDIARSRYGYPENLGFFALEITPENIDQLPQFDITLFMSVYQHWMRSYGVEEAKTMLKTICGLSNKVIIELPGNQFLPLNYITVIAENQDTNEKYQTQVKAKPTRLSDIEEELPVGTYSITLNAEGYTRSNTVSVRITKARRLSKPLKIDIDPEDKSLTIVNTEDKIVDQEQNFAYYESMLESTLPNDVSVIDNMICRYKGGNREDPIFVLDTSDFNP